MEGGGVYQVCWGRILSCEEGKGISMLWEECNVEKGKGEEYHHPYNINALGKISRGEEGISRFKIWYLTSHLITNVINPCSPCRFSRPLDRPWRPLREPVGPRGQPCPRRGSPSCGSQGQSRRCCASRWSGETSSVDLKCLNNKTII